MQSRLSSQLIQVWPFISRHHSQQLGGLALHRALPSYGRRTISDSSIEGSHTPALVSQTREHKSLTEASQNNLQPIGRNPEADAVLSNTMDSREPLCLGEPNKRPPIDDEELRSLQSNSFVKPDAPWGFVIYRAVYGKESDEPWKRMLGLLRDTVTRSLLPNNLKEPVKLDPQFELTVMEDEERFAGAGSHAIREAFREWVVNDLPPRVLHPDAEGGIDNIRAMLRSKTIGEVHEEPTYPWYLAPPRWSFCILVDDICLRSLDSPESPVVKMVNLRFNGGRCETIAEGWEDGETDDPQEDVGWMYTYAHGYKAWYQVLSDPSSWDDEDCYMRSKKEEYPSANDVDSGWEPGEMEYWLTQDTPLEK